MIEIQYRVVIANKWIDKRNFDFIVHGDGISIGIEPMYVLPCLTNDTLFYAIEDSVHLGKSSFTGTLREARERILKSLHQEMYKTGNQRLQNTIRVIENHEYFKANG